MFWSSWIRFKYDGFCKQERRENLGDDRSHGGQRERGIRVRLHPFALQEGVSDRGEHHMMVPAGMVPAGMEAPFEVIETELFRRIRADRR